MMHPMNGDNNMRKTIAALLILVMLFPYAAFAASYCPYCGAKVDASYSFCPSCGKSLPNVSGSPETKTSNGYIPGFLHDLDGIKLAFNTLVSKANQNVGSNGKVVYSESNFPLKFAFSLREKNCFENHLDSRWMVSKTETYKGDSTLYHNWYFSPISMTYSSTRISSYDYKPCLEYENISSSNPSFLWDTMISYADYSSSGRQKLMVITVKNKKIEVGLSDSYFDLNINYEFDGRGNVLLYSEVPEPWGLI